MNKVIKDAAMMAAVGAAGFYAYKLMSPSDKEKLTRDAKRTAADMSDVKRDVTRMAGTIRETF